MEIITSPLFSAKIRSMNESISSLTPHIIPHFQALRSAPTAVSGGSLQKQILAAQKTSTP